MKSEISEALKQTLVQLNKEITDRENCEKITSDSNIILHATKVLSRLTTHPYLTGEEIAKKTGVSMKNIPLIYKIIQKSDIAQDYLKQSENRDYFNVVNHYFNRRFFTVVFFVGTTCPSKCIFCPNVSIDKNGKRTLYAYNNSGEQRLKQHHIEKIFSDLNILKAKGTDILVKISGGLEPLTDITTMSWITSLANEIKLPVKLFTNGLLLNSEKRRKEALKTNDIRISLSTTDAEQYQRICFENNSNVRTKALNTLKKSIKQLVFERNKINPSCKIGFNSVIIPSNIDQLTQLIDLSLKLSIDYIDFKPDYFSTFDMETELKIKKAVDNAMEYAQTISPTDLFINFTGSLNKSNLYWNHWRGYCDSLKQTNHKIFITPYGHCSPVHYGAFPHKSSSGENSLNKYSIGQINDSWSLSDTLREPLQSPKVTLKQLNPFELMLNLEITREEKDEEYGIPLSCSPYHTSLRGTISDNL